MWVESRDDLFAMTHFCQGILVRVHTHHNKSPRQLMMDRRREKYHLLTQGVHHSCASAHQQITQKHMSHQRATGDCTVDWQHCVEGTFCFLFFLCDVRVFTQLAGHLGFGLVWWTCSRFFYEFLFVEGLNILMTIVISVARRA